MLRCKLACFIAVLLILNSAIAQVTLQTGSANFNIPMFNWQDNKSRLYSNVSISYNSGNGLKVNEIASNIGQGWSFIGGGVISRMQVGQPDDQKPYPSEGSEMVNDITKYPAGFLYTTVDPKKGCPPALTRYPTYGHMNQVYVQHNKVSADRQFDYFTFQFNGKVGMFVIDPVNGGTIRSVGDTKVKFSLEHDESLINQGIRTTITSFTIQDVDGLIYKFSAKGLTKILRNDYCDSNLTTKYSQPKIKNQYKYHQSGFDLGPSAAPFVNSQMANPFVVNSWYLSEIEDPFTHRKVLFNYVIKNMNNLAGTDINYQDTDQNDFIMLMHKRSVTKSPQLSSITYPDGHNVTLHYGDERVDLKGDKILTDVSITYKSRAYSKFELKSSYFILNRYGKPITDYQKKVARLCLLSVKKIGVDNKDDSPPYLFDYYLGSSNVDDFVPPPYSYAADVWGYFNGDKSKGYVNEDIPLTKTLNDLSFSQLVGLCYLRKNVSGISLNPKNGYAKNGLLKQIIYPTGGTLSYEYDQNMGDISGERMIGGVHVSRTSSTDGGGSNDCGNPIVTNYQYTLEGSGLSSIWGIEMPNNAIQSVNQFDAEKKFYKWSLSDCQIFGCCDYRYKYPGILSEYQGIDLSYITDLMNTLSPALGIVSIATTVMNIISYASGGVSPLSIILDVISGLITVATTCFINNSRTTSTVTYFNMDLNQAAPLPTQFKRVVVIEGSGSIGKTVHDFTNSEDFAVYYPAVNSSFTTKQRFAAWAYGLPKKVTQFDVNNFKVKEINNEYDFKSSYLAPCDIKLGCPVPSPLPTTLVSCNCDVDVNKSQRSTDWSNPSKYGDLLLYRTSNTTELKVDFYGVKTGRTELTRTLERVFKKNSSTQYIENETSYYYNQNNYEIRTIVSKQSDGKSMYKDIYYTSDFSTGILATLNANNVVSLPVSTRVSFYTNPELKYLSEEVTEFIQLGNGNIKPARTLEQRFAQPTPGNSITFYAGPGSSNPNYKITQQFIYDGTGNLIGLKDEGGRVVSNIYGYDDKFVVASIVNADPLLDKIAYSSFEDGGINIPSGYNFGGWIVGGQSDITFASTPKVTSTGTFNLKAQGGNSLSATGLNTAKKYILSFWTDLPTVLVSGGATLKKTGPTFNGFTFYEYEVSQGTSVVSITNNGSSLLNIDELRLYPANARMKTISYQSISTNDLLFGRKSESDENNRITHYEFDPLGRITFIRDEQGSILKMYEYNSISEGKRSGCPTTYYNKLISEEFKKSNCSIGYVGSDVVYAIPAQRYSSTISQADADAKAENELLVNGQAFADANGICKLLYYNATQSRLFTKQNCPIGFNGNGIMYTVADGTYSSLISQADADQKALDDIDANGQVYANDQNGCSISVTPIWDVLDEDSTYCLTVNGQLPAHQFIKETNINPNSPLYGQTRWSDIGPQSSCPANMYFNAERIQNFTRNNCSGGISGSVVAYRVPPGKYSSAISQADADLQAISDANTNGQNYANQNGVCATNIQITCLNTRSFNYDVRFANEATGVTYAFYVNANTNGNIGTVPSGTYTIYICPFNSYDPSNNYSVGYNYITGVVCASFYSISIVSQTEVRIY
jgi:hypothetical protein